MLHSVAPWCDLGIIHLNLYNDAQCHCSAVPAAAPQPVPAMLSSTATNALAIHGWHHAPELMYVVDVCSHWRVPCRSKPPQAFYSTRQDYGSFHTTVYLPSSSGLKQPITSALPASNSKASKNAAALEALRQLLAARKLDDYLQPVI